MSSRTGKLVKRIKRESMIFPASMYTNCFGSIAICDYIFTEDKESYPLQEVKKLWRKIEKNPRKFIDWSFDDKDFIKKTLDMFKLEKPKEWSIACVMSSFNVLFLPFDKEHNVALPLREDGIPPASLRHGKVYPIDSL